MIIISKYMHNQIVIATQNRSVAELSTGSIDIKGLNPPVFYFHRIKVLRENEGIGEGKELMIEICRYADQ